MESSDHFLGINVAKLGLKHGGNLSAALHSNTISAAEGQRISLLTNTTNAKLHTEKKFQPLLRFGWDRSTAAAVNVHRTI